MKYRNTTFNYLLSLFLLFQLPLISLAQVTNDECDGAILIEEVTNFCSAESAYSNINAQQEISSTSCFSANGKDVWFRFRAVERGLRLSIRGNGQGGTLNQPELQLFNTGQCADVLEVITCVPGNISQIAAVDVNVLIPGNTYLFRVHGKNDATGEFQICLDNYAPPENDLCSNPLVLPDVTDYCSGNGAFTNIDAGKELDFSTSSCHTSEGSDVWFQFQAVNPGVRIKVEGQGIGGTLEQPEIQLFEAYDCVAAGARILDCVSGDITNEANLDIGGLIEGQTYLIKVQGRRGTEGTFRLCVDNFPSPINDDCGEAIFLPSVESYGSAPREYSNIDATVHRDMPDYRCLENSNDVWFRFVAEATDIVITVTGDIDSEFPGGSLEQPEVELFGFNSCPDDMRQFSCATDVNRENIVILEEDGLVQGLEYLIRVQGSNNNTGTFQLDITNFFPPFPPESDCVDAKLLCDKSLIRVDVLEGAGDDPDEARESCLGDAAAFTNSESNSTWYKWIAGNNGDLTFVLTPDTYEDDIDFVLYELPGGINDCNNKQVIRCMASGESRGVPFSQWRNCVGPTGLRQGETDEIEDAGCSDSGDNSYLAPIQLKEGTAYALLINFFALTSTTTGFKIEFGGTGEFQGLAPRPEIITDASTVCVGDEVVFTGENSSFVFGQEEISDFEWSFGAGANPISAVGAGPHRVQYLTPGAKNVSLSLTSQSFSCKAEELVADIIEIASCCEDNSIVGTADSKDEVCDNVDGAIDMSVTSDLPYSIAWNIGSANEDLTNLEDGLYVATLTNTADCSDTVVVNINDIVAFNIEPMLIQPSCNGGEDGAINLQIGTNNPVTITWENPDSTRTSLTNIGQGNYAVTVVDNLGCQQDMVIELTELELELAAAAGIQNPTCSGLADGVIQVALTNGTAPYTYSWADDDVTNNQDTRTNLMAGTYEVTITDQANCTSVTSFDLVEPDPLQIILTKNDISCEGRQDGSIAVTTEGGVGGYNYNWNTGAITTDLMQLDSGLYILTVTDANDCEASTDIRIIEPESIDLQLVDIEDVKCFGEATGLIQVEGLGGTPEYEYSLDGGATYQASGEIMNVPAGTYRILVKDQGDCSTEIEATISQPDRLSVAVFAEDDVVDLGKTTSLEAEVSPSNRPVEYSWSNADLLDCADCPMPSVTPLLPNFFTVTITDNENCMATDSIFLAVRPNRELYVPNVFSPNFDGINDRFELFGGIAAQEIILFRIFDRWGTLVYEKENLPLREGGYGWDGQHNGQEAPAGVYAYYAKVRFIDGAELDFEGDVTIIR